ncbi:MAG: acetate kinase [Opitutales bacterium]|nr:acetate kinase [Opitutales bacterium]
MKILVANLGSTSFKYRLFSFSGEAETLLAKGGYERVEDFGAVISDALKNLIDGGHLESMDDLAGVGFKTVLGKDLSGCVLADERTLAALDGFAQIAPAHNPAYAAGIRQFQRLTRAPCVALFETSFYQWMPESAKHYGVPRAWREAGIRRYGFHGASHKFIAERSAELLGRDDVAGRVRQLYVRGPGEEPAQPLRVISCHLGGSSSVAGMRSGVAMGCSFGLSPQSGLPHNNRVGDLDSMAIAVAMKELGISFDEALRQLSKEGGLLGLSGCSNDIRDVVAAMEAGNADAAVAIDVFVHSIRQWIGSFFFEMGGAEALVFTAGIGENQALVRERVCAGLAPLGIELDTGRNAGFRAAEGDLATPASRTRILVIPTNEELVVARETRRLLLSRSS